MIYPEGSRFSTTTEEEIEREKNLAVAQNRQILQYHLIPRSKGTHLILSQLASKFDSVYDLTLIYSGSRSLDGKYIGAPGIFGIFKFI